MLVPRSEPAATKSRTTTVNDTAAAPTSALRIRILWPTRPFRCASSPRWSATSPREGPGSTLSFNDLAVKLRIPRCILGAAAANRGSESGRGSAVLIPARPHAAHGSARCFFVTGGGQRRHFDGRRTAGPTGSARFVPLAGLDRTLDPGGGRGQRGRA